MITILWILGIAILILALFGVDIKIEMGIEKKDKEDTSKEKEKQ